MDRLAGIHATRKQLIAEIRAYSESQQEDWQRIPWLALQADGRNGYSESYAYCYRYGLWTLHMPNEHGYHGTFVDCASGKIVTSKRTPVMGDFVLFLGSRLDQLNTAKIIRTLQKAASDRIPTWSSPQEFDERARWRQDLIQQLGLSREYTRRRATQAA